MDKALRFLASLPRRPGRFLLAPHLAGGKWLVGLGTPVEVCFDRGLESLPRLLRSGPLGTVVVLGYELGSSLVQAKAREDLGLPRAVAIRVEEAVTIDPLTGEASGPLPQKSIEQPEIRGTALRASLDRLAHREAVERIHEAIRAGDTYQANLTVRFSAPYAGTPEALFAALLASGPQACAAYVDLPGGAAIASASPESLLHYDAATRRASSAPIKGTRPRGSDAAEDERLAAELTADQKELAEHVMIVDLVRNDLGRVATTGSVEVPALFRVDPLPTVHHLVSEVVATLAPEHTLAELVASLFPAGSITGAPKLSAIRLIDELEPVARGPYCGSIGLVRPDGSLSLSVAIRTAVVAGGEAHYGAGGGITIDARPEAEWEELLLKARPFLSAVGASPAW